MAKIDCSVTVNFLRERQRMCNSFKDGCKQCPLRDVSRYTEYTCSDYTYAHPETAIETVQKWSDEHPAKTRLEDLLEKYPGIVVESNGRPVFYPAALGYCNNCDLCRYGDGDTHGLCWNEPVDGGATGKAVE